MYHTICVLICSKAISISIYGSVHATVILATLLVCIRQCDCLFQTSGNVTEFDSCKANKSRKFWG